MKNESKRVGASFHGAYPRSLQFYFEVKNIMMLMEAAYVAIAGIKYQCHKKALSLSWKLDVSKSVKICSIV